MLLAVCECCDLPMKIFVDLERQGSFLNVWQVSKKAAPLALLVKMWGRSPVRTFSWTPVGGWSSVGTGSATHTETTELWVCATGVQLHCSYGQHEPRAGLVVLTKHRGSTDPTPVLGSPCTGRCHVFGLWVSQLSVSSPWPRWITTVLSLTYPIWVYFSALWDAVASTAESTAGVSYLNAFTCLGEV